MTAEIWYRCEENLALKEIWIELEEEWKADIVMEMCCVVCKGKHVSG